MNGDIEMMYLRLNPSLAIDIHTERSLSVRAPRIQTPTIKVEGTASRSNCATLRYDLYTAPRMNTNEHPFSIGQ
jgi:hypothetical protein